jgi:hypothetical protein
MPALDATVRYLTLNERGPYAGLRGPGYLNIKLMLLYCFGDCLQETSTGYFSLERFLLNLETGPGETVKTSKHDLNYYFQVFLYGNASVKYGLCEIHQYISIVPTDVKRIYTYIVISYKIK